MQNLNMFKQAQNSLKHIEAVIVLCLFAAGLMLGPAPSDAIEPEKAIHPVTSPDNETPLYVPVYRIPVRVHIAQSGWRPAHFRIIFDEMNDIWRSQAGICFEFQAVNDDKPLVNGVDLWFMPELTEYSWANGYYRGDHEIYVRDNPILGPAAHPAQSSAARTAAHELGHVLGLPHRQDSDDNLMRSKTYGRQLNKHEILQARTAAARKTLRDLSPLRCGTPEIPEKD